MKKSNPHLIIADSNFNLLDFISFYYKYRDPSLDYPMLEELENKILQNLKNVGVNGKEYDDDLFLELDFLKNKIASYVSDSGFNSDIQNISLPFKISYLTKSNYLGAKRINVINDFSEPSLDFRLSFIETINYLLPNYVNTGNFEKRQRVEYSNISNLIKDNSGSLLLTETYQFDRLN